MWRGWDEQVRPRLWIQVGEGTRGPRLWIQVREGTVVGQIQ